VAEITFAEWTKDKILRTPVFNGLREDKSPEEIKMEKPKRTPQPVRFTHPDKVIFKKERITKEDIGDYYQTVSKWLLPHVQNRPLALIRCPSDSKSSCFFSKHFKESLPDHVLRVSNEDDPTQPYVSVDSMEGVKSLVQRGVVEIHTWNCHSDDLNRPDQIVLDLDPGPQVDFEQVKTAALELKKILNQLRIRSFLKVTGGKGLHVQFPVTPIYTWPQIKQFARTLSLEMTSRQPELYTDKFKKSGREKKILVDYLRNSKGATAVTAYSLRARELSSVAMPLDWDQLEALPRSNAYSLKESLNFLKKRKSDPWKDYFKLSQKISILDQTDSAE
jgi:bifunctional non-homologous end joining protein LigD